MLSASLLVPVALLCVWIGGWFYLCLTAMGFVGVVREWGTMCRWKLLPLLLGFLYALLAFAALLALRRFGSGIVYYVLIVVWSSDIGAYVVGRLLGGRRLAPSISPGKTWSGAVGGLLASIVFGGIWVGFNVSVLAASAVLGIASQLGDLGESALKRSYGVKDSGRLIPGHGGVLDRLDGLMAASIVAGLVLAFEASRGGGVWP